MKTTAVQFQVYDLYSIIPHTSHSDHIIDRLQIHGL